jgi:hypothetical protein
MPGALAIANKGRVAQSQKVLKSSQSRPTGRLTSVRHVGVKASYRTAQRMWNSISISSMYIPLSPSAKAHMHRVIVKLQPPLKIV